MISFVFMREQFIQYIRFYFMLHMYFSFKMFFRGKKIEQKQTDCSRTSLPLETSFSSIKKDWLPNWLNCFFCTVQWHVVLLQWTCALILDELFCEKVLFSPQSQSPDLWVLPPFLVTRFCHHHYCFCSVSCNTV